MPRIHARNRGYIGAIVSIILFLIVVFGLTIAANYAIRTDQKAVGTGTVERNVYFAIVGEPSKGRFGYLGDVGDYPSSLADLITDPGLPGWRGPYITDVSFDSNGSLLDSYYSPLEYFLSAGVVASPSTHAVAIISRGPDHNSSNTSTLPNVWANFNSSVTNPTLSGYKTNAFNTDNLVTPNSFVSGSAFNLGYNGTLSIVTTNKDSSSTFVPRPGACPLAYNVKIVSETRGTNDQAYIPFGGSLTADLIQGSYKISFVANSNTSQTYYTDSVTILPGATTTRRYSLAPVATSAAQNPNFNMTLTNTLSAGALFLVNQSVSAAGTLVAGGSTVNGASHVYSVPACATVTARLTGVGGTLEDQWVMPTAIYTRVVNGASTLTVTNIDAAKTHRQVVVLMGNPGIAVGTVYRGRIKSFVVTTGARITITDGAGANLTAPFAKVTGNTALSF